MKWLENKTMKQKDKYLGYIVISYAILVISFMIIGMIIDEIIISWFGFGLLVGTFITGEIVNAFFDVRVRNHILGLKQTRDESKQECNKAKKKYDKFKKEILK